MIIAAIADTVAPLYRFAICNEPLGCSDANKRRENVIDAFFD